MHSIRAILSLVVLMGSGALAGDSITSPCGHAVAPENSDNAGAVCISVCSPGFAYNGCTTSQAPVAPTSPGESLAPAPVIEFLSIRIYGDKLSVAELAEAVGHATGWTTEVPPGLGSEMVRPAKKQLSGSKAQRLRFGLQHGGKLLVNIDNEQKKVAVFRL